MELIYIENKICIQILCRFNNKSTTIIKSINQYQQSELKLSLLYCMIFSRLFINWLYFLASCKTKQKKSKSFQNQTIIAFKWRSEPNNWQVAQLGDKLLSTVAIAQTDWLNVVDKHSTRRNLLPCNDKWHTHHFWESFQKRSNFRDHDFCLTEKRGSEKCKCSLPYN